MIAATPTPPYWAVIFTAIRAEGDNGYGAMSAAMAELAAKQPGYLGHESAHESVGLTVSYWRDLESIDAWKADVKHLAAQKKGREAWYRAYTVRIARVERDYALETRD